MNLWLRSILFNIVFYGWTFICSIIFLPSLLLSREMVLKIAKFWIGSVLWICRAILKLQIKILGKTEYKGPVIIASKHQSAWETFIFHYLLSDPSMVLKRELLWIPFFGWYLQKLGMVSLSRSKNSGVKDLKRLLKDAGHAIQKHRPLVIFPEGTRSKPHQKTTYYSGIASLYLHLNIPVIPVAHNAGLYWPRRGFLKYPGCIILEFLDPIQPGFSKQQFMHILEERIEKKTHELLKESQKYVNAQ